MITNHISKPELTSGDLNRAAYEICAADRASNIVPLPGNAPGAEFRRKPHFLKLFIEKKIRINQPQDLVGGSGIGPNIALLAVMVSGLCFANACYGGDRVIGVPVPSVRVFVPAPPEVRLPRPDFFLFGGGYDRRHDADDYGRRGRESRGWAHPHGDRDDRGHRDGGDRKR